MKSYHIIDKIQNAIIKLNLRRNGIKYGNWFHAFNPTHIYGDVTIGNNVSLNYNVSIDALPSGSVVIGNNVSIGPNTVIRACNHDYMRIGRHISRRIVIKDNVWIGANCVILPGVVIGSGTVIGAGSIVTKDIPDKHVAVGNPCRVIKSIPTVSEEEQLRQRINFVNVHVAPGYESLWLK